MRVGIRHGRRRQGLGVAYAVLITVAALIVRVWPGSTRMVPFCPWRTATGLPCPFCGGTHAFATLAHGQMVLAWEANPLVVLVVVGVYLWGLLDLLSFLMKRSLVLDLKPGEKKWLTYLVGAALFANWLYLILVSRI